MLKADAINQAYAEIRISGLTTEQVPEETELALRELDQVMYQWQAMGRDVGYQFPPPTVFGEEMIVSDPGDTLGVHPWAIQGVICTLAKNLVSYFGKEVPPVLAGKARFGVNVIKQQTVKLDPQQYPNRMPIGSGNNRWGNDGIQRYYYPRYGGRVQPTEIAPDQTVQGVFNFSPDIPQDIFLTSYTLTVEPAQGIEIVSETFDQVNNTVTYLVKASTLRDGVLTCTAEVAGGTSLVQQHTFQVTPNQVVVSYA